MTKNKQLHFEISERKILLRLFDVMVVLFLLHIIGNFFDFHYFKITEVNFYWSLVLSVYLLFFGTVFEMYHLPTASNISTVLKSIVLTSSVTVLTYLLTPILTPSLPENRFQIVVFYFSIIFALMVWRLFYVKFLASHRFFKKAIIICGKEELGQLVLELQSNDPHFIIPGFVDISSELDLIVDYGKFENVSPDNLIEYIQKKNISEVVIASHDTQFLSPELYNKLLYLLENGFLIREYSQVYESITQRIPLLHAEKDFYKYFPFSRNNQNHLYLLTTRFMEVLIASIGLLVGLGILPLIVLGNFIGNRGPLFYTQERVGKNGKVFNILKLRSMVLDAEKNGAVFAQPNDVRITSFGKFLRKSRLDEVPQFVNVLKGEMGIIGPRPERPIFVSEIAKRMPFYETRHVIKPGLTGWAQVNYSYGDSLEDSLVKLQYDLYYIKHRGVFIDLSIAVKTISAVLFYRGQ